MVHALSQVLLGAMAPLLYSVITQSSSLFFSPQATQNQVFWLLTVK